MVIRRSGEISTDPGPGIRDEGGGEGVVDEVDLDGEVEDEEGEADYGELDEAARDDVGAGG